MTDDKDTYPNAGRDSGYVDREGRPVGEDLVNVLTALIAQIETKLLLTKDEIRKATHAAIKDYAQDVARQFYEAIETTAQLRRDDLTYREEQQIRLDAFKVAQDATLLAVQEVAASWGKEAETLRGGQAAIIDRLDAREILDDERYEAAQDFQQQSTADRERLNQEVGAIKELLAARPEQRQHEHQAIVDTTVQEVLKRLKAGDGDHGDR